MYKRQGKGNGLKKLCSYLGLMVEDSIAVGDSMNDISMVEAAGLGVAMGNADLRLKARAKLIAPTNDEDGVAYLLNKAIKDEL